MLVLSRADLREVPNGALAADVARRANQRAVRLTAELHGWQGSIHAARRPSIAEGLVLIGAIRTVGLERFPRQWRLMIVGDVSETAEQWPVGGHSRRSGDREQIEEQRRAIRDQNVPMTLADLQEERMLCDALRLQASELNVVRLDIIHRLVLVEDDLRAGVARCVVVDLHLALAKREHQRALVELGVERGDDAVGRVRFDRDLQVLKFTVRFDVKFGDIVTITHGKGDVRGKVPVKVSL